MKTIFPFIAGVFFGESKDLAGTMPEKVKELQTQWDAWNATLVQPLWGQGSLDNDGKKLAK